MAKKTIGVISDTHGLIRPEVIIALQPCDLIIHAGDIGSMEVVNTLKGIAPLIAVRGNVDKDDWCYQFPKNEVIEIEKKYIYVIHDLDELNIDPKAAGIDVVICGHSHKPLLEELQGVIYINPGSVGPRRFNLPTALSIMEIDQDDINIRFVDIS